MARPKGESQKHLEKLSGLLSDGSLRKGLKERQALKRNGPETAKPVNLPEGEWVGRGVYRMTYDIPYGRMFGARGFENPVEKAERLKPWTGGKPPVFLDLETTGLSGGAGAYAFLAGLGLCGETSFKVIQLFLTGPAWENNWLEALEAELPDSFSFVTYNGIAFDMPMLRSRYTLARRPPPWNGAGHMDLLLLARHFYRKRLPSCSLSSVESSVLGVKRSGEDIPGSEIPSIYSGYLSTNDAAPLHGVFYHNRLDIVSLAALQTKIGELVAMENCSGEDLVRCGDLWYIMGRIEYAEAAWRTALGQEDGICGASLRLADQSKRSGNFEGAKKHLELALEYDRHPLETLESLAKLEEHRFQNYETALEYAEQALLWLDSRRSLRDYKWSLQRREVQRRIARLRKKLEKISV